MYAKRNNSANYGSLLQTERLMSDREMLGRAENLSVFAKFQGDEVGGSKERCPLQLNFDAKKVTK